MRTALDQLYRLQDRIRFVQTRERERDAVPAELTEVDRQFKEKLEAVRDLKGRLTEAEIEHRRAAAELSEMQEKLRKYQAQLRSVQTSREYSAILNEIDGAEKLVRGTEDRVLALEEEIETAKGEILELESRIKPRELAEFRRLVEKKGGLAIVRVVNNSCSACHVKIRPAALQILKAGTEIVTCDSCKRILYWDPKTS